MDTVASWAEGVALQYGIDPRVAAIVYLASIPLFYAFLAVIARGFYLRKKERGGTPQLLVGGVGFVLAFLMPYGYVLLASQGLPPITWLLVGIALVAGVISAVRLLRRRVVSAESEG